MLNFLLIFCILTGILGTQKYNRFEFVPARYVIPLTDQQGIQSIMWYDQKNKKLFRSVSAPKAQIEIFDLSKRDGVFVKSIIPNEGAPSVFAMGDNGSLWFWDVGRRTYYHIGDNGEVLNKIAKSNEWQLMHISDGSSGLLPLNLIDGQLYATGWCKLSDNADVTSQEYRQHGVVRNINTSTKEVKLIGRITPSSQTHFYGSSTFYSGTVKGDKLVVSPYFSDEIQEIDLRTHQTVFVKTPRNKYSDLIKPMSPIADFNKFSNTQGNEFFTSNYAFVHMVYDEYHDVFYRFLRMPNQVFGNLKMKLLVLDADYNLLFDIDIPGQYRTTNFFLTEAGIHFLDYSGYLKDQSKMKYDLFKLMK